MLRLCCKQVASFFRCFYDLAKLIIFFQIFLSVEIGLGLLTNRSIQRGIYDH